MILKKIINHVVPKQLTCFGIRMVIILLASPYLFAQHPENLEIGNKKINITDFEDKLLVMMDDIGIPGLSLAIINDHEIVYSQVFGVKEVIDEKSVNKNVKLDKATIFEVCSLSKSYLLPVVYGLVDQGKLDLDRPIHEYMEHERLNHDSRYKQITSRMILGHSSGIENWQDNHDPKVLELMSNPGEAYVYSGEGYNYLAKVAESLIGMPIESYMKTLVYEPLGLENTFSNYLADGSFPTNYAVGHDIMENAKKKSKSDVPVPSSGISSTAEDYAKLIIGLFSGDLLSENSKKALSEPVIPLGPTWPDTYYAAGFEVLLAPNGPLVFQGGSNEGFKAQLCHSINTGQGLVLLTNGDRGKLITSILCDTFFGDLFKSYFENDPGAYYPSKSASLFKTYRKEGIDAMKSELEGLTEKESLSRQELLDLGFALMGRENELVQDLLKTCIEKYPNYPSAYFLSGLMQKYQGKFKEAHDYFVKSKDRNFFDPIWVAYEIKETQEKLAQVATED